MDLVRVSVKAAPGFAMGLVWIPLDEIEEWAFYPKTLRPILSAGLPDAGATYLGDVN